MISISFRMPIFETSAPISREFHTGKKADEMRSENWEEKTEIFGDVMHASDMVEEIADQRQNRPTKNGRKTRY